MYGVYSWNAGAAAVNVVADLLALMGGAVVDDLSLSANKAACSVGGAASGWSVVDAAYGVIACAGEAGGPGMVARITVSTGPRIQLAAVDGWVMGSHSASFATSPADVSNVTTAAGSVSFLATEKGLLLASSDWGYWAAISEVKRDGPALGDALAPGGVLLNQSGYCYMPRLKAPAAVGDLNSPSCTFASAYGALSSSAARDRSERLYLPMAPAVVSYYQVPVGEIAGLLVAGGYGQSGDFVMDAAGDQWLIAKAGQYAAVMKRV